MPPRHGALGSMRQPEGIHRARGGTTHLPGAGESTRPAETDATPAEAASDRGHDRRPWSRSSSPANGSATNDTTPTFSGSAGAEPLDSSTVTVKVYSGSTVSGSPVQTLTATELGGAWSVAASSALPDGTYTAQASQSDDGREHRHELPKHLRRRHGPAGGGRSPRRPTGPPQSQDEPTFSGTAGTATGPT